VVVPQYSLNNVNAAAVKLAIQNCIGYKELRSNELLVSLKLKWLLMYLAIDGGRLEAVFR